MDNEKFQELVLKKLEVLDAFQSTVQNMDKRMGNMEGRMDSFENLMDSLVSKVDKIDANQVRMENELTEKIRALFDDRSVNQDYFKTIKNTLARIENNIQTQSFMIIELKEKQEDQETELRLLRAEK